MVLGREADVRTVERGGTIDARGVPVARAVAGSPSLRAGGGEMALTGRFNFKRSWFGKLMLEVETR